MVPFDIVKAKSLSTTNKVSHGWNYYSQHKTIISIEIYQISCLRKMLFNSPTIDIASDPDEGNLLRHFYYTFVQP